MEERQEIRKLARALKARGVDKDSGVIISLQVRKDGKRDRLLQWMADNPEATPSEIMEKARLLHRER